MASLGKTRRIRLLVFAATALLLASVLIGHGMRDGIQFFRTPSQTLAEIPHEREVFRLGGMVEPGSIVRDGASVRFRVTDGAQAITVSYRGLLPDLFAEDEGVIATGSLMMGEFRATEILAKHDEDYMPRELVDLAQN